MRLLLIISLALLARLSTAQSIQIDSTSLRAYNLAHEDAGLVNLPRVAQTYKCPVCVQKKLTSRVYFGMSTMTTAYAERYYDESGKLVAPDINTCTTYFRCSHEHRWQEVTTAGKTTLTILPYVER